MKSPSVLGCIALVLSLRITQAISGESSSMAVLYVMEMTHRTSGWDPIPAGKNDIYLVSELLCHEPDDCQPHIIFSGYIDKYNFDYIYIEAQLQPYAGETVNFSVSMSENNGGANANESGLENYSAFIPLTPLSKNPSAHYALFVTENDCSGFNLIFRHSKTSSRDSNSLVIKSLKVYGSKSIPPKLYGDSNSNSNSNGSKTCQQSFDMAISAIALSVVSFPLVIGTLICCYYGMKD